MDLLKAQFAKLQQQLSGLTASQKMLAVTLVTIMVMTLFWWARYAGDPEMVPLLNQSFTEADISQITTHLSAKEIEYTVVGDKVMIPAKRKIEVLADLGFAHLLPQKTNTGFDDIVKMQTPWDSADKTARFWIEGKQRTLSAVIGNFPNVDNATVVIDPHDERRFDGRDVVPTAMVTIFTRDHEQGRKGVKQLATAAADTIAGAEAGLSPAKVTVVVDGVTVPVADKSADGSMEGSDSIVDATREHEAMFRDTIERQLGFINGLFVSVRVDLNTKRTEIQQTTVDPKNPIHLAASETEHTSETPIGSGNSGEPGPASNVQSNSGVSIGGGGATGGAPAVSTEEQTNTQYVTDYNHKTEKIIQGPGDAAPTSASIRVPRSYFIGIYKNVNKGKEPDDGALAALMKEELDKIRQDVKSCTGIKADDAVTVNWYADGAPATVLPVAQAGNGAVSMLLSSHGKDWGVGALAVVSLFMMMMMVKKASPSPLPAAVAAAAAASDKGQSRLQADADMVGEVAEGDRMMDGMELDDESAKTQQMVDQVSSLVAENPDGAAALVQRWLSRG